MSKTCFLLISVVERDILTEMFSTVKDAWATMRLEMIQACRPNEREIIEDVLMSLKYGDVYEEPNNGDFGIGKWSAYINDDVARHTCDWRVVEIVIE